MKLNNIHIQNILSYKDEIIEFNNDLNIFIGPNGGGKSNLINIIIYILKRFCIKNYDISLVTGVEMQEYIKYSIREKNPIYGDNEEHFLSKHKNLSNENRAISFNIEFEEQDRKNFEEIIKYKDEISEFFDCKISDITYIGDKYQVQIDEVKKFFKIDWKNIEKLKNIKIEIMEIDNQLKVTNNNQEDYMVFMKYFNLIYEILNIMGIDHKIKNTFIFFEAYRNNSSETTKVGISKYNANSYQNLQSLQNIKSLAYSLGTRSTYIMLATKKFGKLLRQSIEEDNGIKKFEENYEYLKLRSFFKDFEYDIHIKCIDIEDNIYQFFLKKNGIEIEIDSISSGEREIINFIFGLFLEEIRDGIVIIDEPELHLHPNWQKKLINILKKETKDKNIQIMFVTHSGSFINYDLLDNIFRIYMDKNGYTKCIKINDLTDGDTENDIRKKLNIINATNNEKIFFSKAVILVEGITDKIIFEKIFEKETVNNFIDIEFVNINGKNNLLNFTLILDKLGIKWFYIGDNDNLKEHDEMKKYYDTDYNKIKDDLKTKNKTYYCNKLISNLEELSKNENYNIKEVIDAYNDYKNNVICKKPNLGKNEVKEINNFIEDLYKQNRYYLKKGDIENYIGSSNDSKAKSFEKIINISYDEEEYKKFSNSEGYKELVLIIEDIAQKIEN